MENIKFEKKENKKIAEKENKGRDIAEADVKTRQKHTRLSSWAILLLVNFLMLVFSGYLIVSLPGKARDLNKVKSDEQKVKESKNVDITGLEYQPTKDSVDRLENYYPTEAGVIAFIEAIEKLKVDGYLKNFSLVSQNAVKDKTGSYGIPFIVEIDGNWEKINVSLQELQKLPYLVRAVNVEANIVGQDLINFKYGGFLYVSDNLAKTR